MDVWRKRSFGNDDDAAVEIATLTESAGISGMMIILIPGIVIRTGEQRSLRYEQIYHQPWGRRIRSLSHDSGDGRITQWVVVYSLYSKIEKGRITRKKTRNQIVMTLLHSPNHHSLLMTRYRSFLILLTFFIVWERMKKTSGCRLTRSSCLRSFFYTPSCCFVHD